MAILKVARMGHPVLRRKARALDPTEVRTAPLQKLIDDMIETMQDYAGIGLAGPQVHESLRLFIAGIEQPDGSIRVMPFVNPEVTTLGTATAEDWEGCLSIPDIRGRVVRPEKVIVRALDRRAKPFELELSGYPARVVQHETDHLDGILFFDRMRSFETLTFLEEFTRFWRSHDEEEE
jgi:peptide deformylase